MAKKFCQLCGHKISGYTSNLKFCCKYHQTLDRDKRILEKKIAFEKLNKKCQQCSKKITFKHKENRFCSRTCRQTYLNTGKKRTAKERLNIKNGVRRFCQTPEGKNKILRISNNRKGKPQTLETRIKISIGQKKIWTPERRKAQSDERKGKPQNLPEETRQRMSKRQSETPTGGTCKLYSFKDQLLQGTWERNLAILFEWLGIEWLKLRGKGHSFAYTLNGKIRRYTPDFLLPELSLYVEVKGWWSEDDIAKMGAMKEQYPDLNIAIVERKDYLTLGNFLK